MASKPRIPDSTLARIRQLADQGLGYRRIAAELQWSIYRVRKALDPDFPVRERARWRRVDQARAAARASPEAKAAKRAAYADDCPRAREKARLRMAAHRARKRAARAAQREADGAGPRECASDGGLTGAGPARGDGGDLGRRRPGNGRQRRPQTINRKGAQAHD